MRLLNFTIDGSYERYELKEFIRDAIPRFAILSHTWEDDEVLFDDITSGNPSRYTGKAGWTKIKQSCEQAQRDGLEYLWADTVCINKESSAELSEAINSMFHWYSAADVCYAYLCDLPEKGALECSRWFTRGWTLQEMIAPTKLVFYDRHWRSLGRKDEMLDLLCSITGVDTRALRGANLRFFSVARKMSWASRRCTTRVEDMAYCLLGIFDIAMPLLYGEGARAFMRLQEEIIQEYDDESLFAWVSDAAGKSPHQPHYHHSGVLALSPAAFANSADYVPCLTPVDEVGISGPITVTSRGIRLEVAVETDGEDRNTLVVRLNCKRLAFDRASGMRMGIVVVPLATIQGYPNNARMYARAQPHRLVQFVPNPAPLTVQTVFLSKENQLPSQFDNSSFDVFFVRQTPRWPEGQQRQFRLVQALPTEAWNKIDDMFRRPRSDADTAPFVLVFRRDAEPGASDDRGFYDHFIVALGGERTSDQAQDSFLSVRIWLNAVFRRTRKIEDLDVQAEVARLGQEDKTVEVEGAGIRLKCHIRPEIIRAQPVFCVDLLVEKASPPRNYTNGVNGLDG